MPDSTQCCTTTMLVQFAPRGTTWTTAPAQLATLGLPLLQLPRQQSPIAVVSKQKRSDNLTWQSWPQPIQISLEGPVIYACMKMSQWISLSICALSVVNLGSLCNVALEWVGLMLVAWLLCFSLFNGNIYVCPAGNAPCLSTMSMHAMACPSQSH